MSRDTSRTHLHLHRPSHADIFEEFTRPLTHITPHSSYAPHSHFPSYPGAGATMYTPSSLPPEPIYVPPQHQPPNPEDEDDVVPDQHAAFGIQQATQRKREAEWKDLGLGELARSGGMGGSGGGGGGGMGASGVGGMSVGLRRGGLGSAGVGGGGTGVGIGSSTVRLVLRSRQTGFGGGLPR